MAGDSLLAIFQFSFVVSFGAVVSPGPVSAAIVTEAPRHGWRVGPLVASGHTFLELIIVIFLSLGLSASMASPTVRTIIAVCGGAVLIWIGASYVIGSWKATIQLPRADGAVPSRSTFSLILLGMLTTLSNPFWYTWWVTVAAGYLAQAQAISPNAIAVFYLGHISADFVWDTALAATTSAGRRWLTDRRYRILILLTGGFMLYLGFAFLNGAIQGLTI
ncbi:MAG: LysE family transporter [Anaerolineales bacterium]|nr:LysE family transporter [Anaerolineales bacterium]